MPRQLVMENLIFMFLLELFDCLLLRVSDVSTGNQVPADHFRNHDHPTVGYDLDCHFISPFSRYDPIISHTIYNVNTKNKKIYIYFSNGLVTVARASRLAGRESRTIVRVLMPGRRSAWLDGDSPGKNPAVAWEPAPW